MLKPYYQTKLGKLYHGDCLEILPQLKEKVDLVLTDPPYGIDKAEWDSSFPKEVVWSSIKNVLVNNGSLLVFPGESFLPNKLSVLFSFFNYQWIIVWYKPNAMQFSKVGHSKQSIVWWLSKGPSVNIRPKNMVDVIVVNMMEKEDRNIKHPSPKPVNVIQQLVLKFSTKDSLVLDPFLGSGTLALVCERLNRRWIGIELNEEYCKLCVDRISKESKRSSMRLSNRKTKSSMKCIGSK